MVYCWTAATSALWLAPYTQQRSKVLKHYVLCGLEEGDKRQGTFCAGHIMLNPDKRSIHVDGLSGTYKPETTHLETFISALRTRFNSALIYQVRNIAEIPEWSDHPDR